MRLHMLLLAFVVMSGCTATPLPAVDSNMAWIDFATPTPGGKVLMAEKLDGQRLRDGRFFQVSSGSHELEVRFDFEVFGGGGLGLMSEPQERLCYLTVRYDHFEAGQRYRLEARNLAFTPSARLYDAKREIVAEDRQARCMP
ncbi:PA0061/PA0062 family lipoprotein [Pseudomonas bijieensis]|uniref:Lipoprotein n=1 Tax=Pseudomonas bijieensis TaxID=2681983 RepID=A0A6N1CI74_9PSED|nr:hypothetical protein [Pseudomonas bijieensis]QKS83637.1 hypothetical protein GN234_17520 [Pseudomonas bijieensis]